MTELFPNNWGSVDRTVRAIFDGLECSVGLIVIAGGNASGKTEILRAIERNPRLYHGRRKFFASDGGINCSREYIKTICEKLSIGEMLIVDNAFDEDMIRFIVSEAHSRLVLAAIDSIDSWQIPMFLELHGIQREEYAPIFRRIAFTRRIRSLCLHHATESEIPLDIKRRLGLSKFYNQSQRYYVNTCECTVPSAQVHEIVDLECLPGWHKHSLSPHLDLPDAKALKRTFVRHGGITILADAVAGIMHGALAPIDVLHVLHPNQDEIDIELIERLLVVNGHKAEAGVKGMNAGGDDDS